MATPTAPACRVITANAIAANLLSEVTDSLKQLHVQPRLVGFLANEDPGAKMYAQYCEKTCIENGFQFELRITSKETILSAIQSANEDPSIHGIIVYYPIFPPSTSSSSSTATTTDTDNSNPNANSTLTDRLIQSSVHLSKDVEGLHPAYVHNMYNNIRFLDPPSNSKKSILPCTPLAVVKILEYLHIYNPHLSYGNRLYGHTITVINRSEVVGRPLAALLANDGAKVYSVDLDGVKLFTRGQGIKWERHREMPEPGMTRDDCLALSHVVVSGVPGERFKVDSAKIRDGAVCINFSSQKNFDAAGVKGIASIYVPAIGKVTIAVLLRNLVRLMLDREGGEGEKKEE